MSFPSNTVSFLVGSVKGLIFLDYGAVIDEPTVELEIRVAINGTDLWCISGSLPIDYSLDFQRKDQLDTISSDDLAQKPGFSYEEFAFRDICL
jgi:hypothetical protein